MRAVFAGALAQWQAGVQRLPRPVLGLMALALLAALTLAALDFRREGLRLEGRLRSAEARLTEVRELAAALSRPMDAATTRNARPEGSLLGRSDAALRAAGLAGSVRRLEPQGPGVLIELSAHDWPAFARLLAALEAQALAVTQARVEAVASAGNAGDGRVQARLVVEPLERP